jgi:hypothetical protein
MHPYSTDSNERQLVPLGIVVISVVSAYLLDAVLSALALQRWWLNIPAVFGFYGLWYILFDKKLWCQPLLRKIRLIKVPDLSGTWTAVCESSYDRRQFTAKVTIKQTWRGMSIRWQTDNSRSHSRAATLIVGDIDEYTLFYNYINIPRGGGRISDATHMHRGTVEVRFQPENGNIVGEGEYYSGRDRRNQGALILTRNISDLANEQRDDQPVNVDLGQRKEHEDYE